MRWGALNALGSIFGTGVKAGGAEQLKIWTYTHTLTAGEVAALEFDQTITAVVLAKVRSIVGVRLLAAGSAVRQNYNDESPRAMYLTSTTNCHVYLKTGEATENDVISITIMEAV